MRRACSIVPGGRVYTARMSLELSENARAGHAPARSRAWRYLFPSLVALLAVWFLWKVLGDEGLRQVADRLLSLNLTLTLAAVALTVIRYLTLAFRWELLARREAPVGLAQITPVLMAGNFLSLVTPAVRVAGPILRAYYLSKETGRPRARFYGTIVADQVSNFSIYAAVLAPACVAVTLPGRPGFSFTVAAGLLAALTTGLYLCYRMLLAVEQGRPSLIHRVLGATLGRPDAGGWRGRFITWWEELLHSLAGAVIGARAWWPAFMVSALSYAITVAIQILSFEATGTHVGIAQVCFAISGAGFAQILLAAPGGAGVTEASLVAVFLATGVDAGSATAGVFLARLINYAVVAPWGGVAFFRLQRRYGQPAA